jgi:oxysterol-binding protein-related protein 9/10/11
MTLLEGPLSKWTNMIHGWQFRWFVLDGQTSLLSYFTSKENMSKGERRGCIRLKGAYVGYDNDDDITFTITVDDKTFHLQSRNLDEREKWVSKIERVIRAHTAGDFVSTMDQIVTNSLKNQQDYKDTDAQFDANLTETDAYLQLLIEQLEVYLYKIKYKYKKKQVFSFKFQFLELGSQTKRDFVK